MILKQEGVTRPGSSRGGIQSALARRGAHLYPSLKALQHDWDEAEASFVKGSIRKGIPLQKSPHKKESRGKEARKRTEQERGKMFRRADGSKKAGRQTARGRVGSRKEKGVYAPESQGGILLGKATLAARRGPLCKGQGGGGQGPTPRRERNDTFTSRNRKKGLWTPAPYIHGAADRGSNVDTRIRGNCAQKSRHKVPGKELAEEDLRIRSTAEGKSGRLWSEAPRRNRRLIRQNGRTESQGGQRTSRTARPERCEIASMRGKTENAPSAPIVPNAHPDLTRRAKRMEAALTRIR